MTTVNIGEYDLSFDPNDVGPDLVVECWISQSRRADDPLFDPESGGSVSAGDDEGPPLHGRVTRRDGNRVWVQVRLPDVSNAVP